MSFPVLLWKQEDLKKDIQSLTDYAINYASEKSDYYKRGSKIKRNWAKGLRIIAIVATALGGLLPVLSQILEKNGLHLEPAWATVAITIAVTSIGLDRFFGFSSAWIRFITTQLKIDSKIEQFKLNLENEKFSWVGADPGFDKAKTVINLAVTFINEISQMVQDETYAWMTEFQNVIQKFNDEVNVKADNSRLGGILLTVQNHLKFPNGVKIQLEGTNPVVFQGLTYSFNNLYPKIYKLSLGGTYADDKVATREVLNEVLINVTPGIITPFAVNLE